MCGRLVLTSSLKDRISALFTDAVIEAELGARYNVTPGQRVPVMADPDTQRLFDMRWGLAINVRRPNQAAASLMANARGETVHALASFRESFERRRCLVLADGFYEWKRDPGSRPQPYFFAMNRASPMILAGIWAPSPDHGEAGCAIITTEANQLMHPVHNRMPVILRDEGASLWLQKEADLQTLRNLLQPYPSTEMRCHPVSRRVNRSDSEGPDLIEPVKIIEQTELF